jgi:hypothetical protein
MKPEMKSNEFKLPECVTEYIESVIRRVRYRRRVRREVRRELTDHFVDALADCQNEIERKELGERLVAEFGAAKVLGKLIRRGKKRCRPLWKKAMIRSVQSVLVTMVLFGVYTVWFIRGKPTVRVDYLAKLNQLARPELDSTQNGMHQLEKAKELYIDYKNISLNEPVDAYHSQSDPSYLIADVSKWEFLDEDRSYDSLTAEQRKMLDVWLERNEPAWEEYIQIAEKPYCWREYRHHGSANRYWLIAIWLPEISYGRPLGKVGIWRARRSLAQGRNQDAFNACLNILHVGRHWQRQITLIEQLSGVSLCRTAHREFLFCLKQSTLEKQDLQRLQKEMETVYINGFPLMGFQAFRLTFFDTVQQVFTEGGPGGGHAIPELFELLCSNPEDGRLTYSLFASMYHARRNEIVKQGNKLFSLLDQLPSMSPYERHRNKMSVSNFLETLPRVKYFFLYQFTSGLDRTINIVYKVKALHQAVVTILALKRYKIDQGEYPEKLEELSKGGYLRQLPDDPYSAGILRYERRGEDFVLYSVGADFENNGGNENPKEPWGEDENGGDRVFWPLEVSHE